MQGCLEPISQPLGTKRVNRCGRFPLLSAPHSLFSIWTDLKRSEKTPGAPTKSWGEWIWLTGSSGLHRNSPQVLNISSIRIFNQSRDPEIPINLRPRRPIYNLWGWRMIGISGSLRSGHKPWWNWCLTPVANFGEVRRAQLAKSTLLSSSLVTLGSFQIF